MYTLALCFNKTRSSSQYKKRSISPAMTATFLLADVISCQTLQYCFVTIGLWVLATAFIMQTLPQQVTVAQTGNETHWFPGAIQTDIVSCMIQRSWRYTTVNSRSVIANKWLRGVIWVASCGRHDSEQIATDVEVRSKKSSSPNLLCCYRDRNAADK